MRFLYNLASYLRDRGMAVEIVFAYGLGQFGQLFFDNFVKKTKLVPNLIKIDVEGAEGRVISGMSKILKECRPLVLFEYHPEGIKSFPDTFEEIFKKFKEVDYSLFRLKDRDDLMGDSLIENYQPEHEYLTASPKEEIL